MPQQRTDRETAAGLAEELRLLPDDLLGQLKEGAAVIGPPRLELVESGRWWRATAPSATATFL